MSVQGEGNREKEQNSIKDPTEIEDALKLLGFQLSDASLKSSTRILILFSLAFNSRLSFVDLLKLTGTGKGSLSNHLEKLEASGFVRTKMIMTFSGSRLVAEITEKGERTCGDIVKAFEKLRHK